jgi:Uma2 family endonuclease
MPREPDTLPPDVTYPSSDGKPVAESDIHIDLVLSVRDRLKARYADRPDVYAAGNLLVYYKKGDPKTSLAPDGFVVFGVPNRDRKSYRMWAEGKGPDVVFEFTSESTRYEDLDQKFGIYQDVWKVPEYFLFDPLGEYLDPPLCGYRLSRGRYVPIRPARGALTSKVLGVSLIGDGRRLILRDVATGAELLTRDEQRAAAEAHRAAAEAQRAVAAEAARAASAEAEVARLRAELAALRAGKPTP